MTTQEKEVKIKIGILKIHEQIVLFNNYVRNIPDLIILRNNAAAAKIAEAIKTAYPRIAVVSVDKPSNGKMDVELVRFGTSISVSLSAKQDSDSYDKLDLKILDHCLEDNVRRFNLLDDDFEMIGKPLTPTIGKIIDGPTPTNDQSAIDLINDHIKEYLDDKEMQTRYNQYVSMSELLKERYGKADDALYDAHSSLYCIKDLLIMNVCAGISTVELVKMLNEAQIRLSEAETSANTARDEYDENIKRIKQTRDMSNLKLHMLWKIFKVFDKKAPPLPIWKEQFGDSII